MTGDEGRHELAERGLRTYVERIASGLGLGRESLWTEVADTGAAYIALRQQLPEDPGRDLALIWDEHSGWALGVENGAGDDLLVLAFYGAELLPPPENVIVFAKDTITHHGDATAVPPARRPVEPAELENRLAGYATSLGVSL